MSSPLDPLIEAMDKCLLKSTTLVASSVPEARGKDLDHIAMAMCERRKPRWRWVPRWLRISWLWESDQALRVRLNATLREARIRR